MASRQRFIWVGCMCAVTIGICVIIINRDHASIIRFTSHTDVCTQSTGDEIRREQLAEGIRYSPVYIRKPTNKSVTQEDLFGYLNTPDVVCEKSVRAGHKGDGGWDVCLSGPYKPKAPCIVYSLGIGYDWTFDDDIVKLFNCSVKAYDPSIKAKSHKRGKYIDFYAKGVSNRDFRDTKHGWDMFSMATLLKEQNHTNKPIDYFKMDIEWAEWQVIPHMAAKGILSQIKQMGLEVHHTGKAITNTFNLIMLLETHGFKKWKMDLNLHCSPWLVKDTRIQKKLSKCLELYFLNMNYIK